MSSLVLDWVPAWDGAVREDRQLQEKAAERLAEYLNQGRVFTSDNKQLKLHAETNRINRSNVVGAPVEFGVRIVVNFDVEVRL